MKNIKSFILIILGILFITSCEDDKNNAILNTTDAVPASLVTPGNESAFALQISEADSSFESFTWIAADYGAAVPRSYRLEMDMMNSDFSDPENLVKTSELSYSLTNAELNLIMFDGGLQSGESHNLYFRVKTTVASDAADTLISPVNVVEVTPYNYIFPVVISPIDGSSHILLKENMNNAFELFEWSTSDYGSEYEQTYLLELDKLGGDFSSAVELAKTEETTFEMTVSELNQVLLDMELEAGTAADLALRVTSQISVRSGILFSEIIKLDITPYSEENGGGDSDIIYLVGGATSAGTENGDNMIPAHYLESSGTDSVFAVCDQLTPNGIGSSDGFYHFVKSIGSWLPMWGSDGTGNWEAGNLLYYTGEGTEPGPILAPATQADYLIKANVVSLSYTVEEIATTMHIVGDGTEAGWDNTIAIPMTKDAPGKFSLIANLNASGGIKLLVNQGEWAPQYGRDENGTWSEGNLSYRPTEDVTDPEFIPAPEEAGSYLIEVDLATNRYKVTMQ